MMPLVIFMFRGIKSLCISIRVLVSEMIPILPQLSQHVNEVKYFRVLDETASVCGYRL